MKRTSALDGGGGEDGAPKRSAVTKDAFAVWKPYLLLSDRAFASPVGGRPGECDLLQSCSRWGNL